MRTTVKQRDEARRGCEFLHGQYCVNSFCACMKVLKDKLKQQQNEKVKGVHSDVRK